MKTEQPGFSKKIIKTSEGEAVRVNKYLSDAGLCSRREADRLIEAGRVSVDGHMAVPGEKVLPGQRVFVDEKEVCPEERLVVLALNKPKGIECTADLTNPDNIIDFIHYPLRVFPVGRLDKNSTGLILLTNAGELANQIMKASGYHEKEYVVDVDRPVSEEFLKKMRSGVTICIDNEDRTVTTRRCRVEKLGSRRFSIVLTQGFNRQIRRMCRALDYEVTSLKRVRVMNILLDDLPEGQWRPVTDSELSEMIRMLKAGSEKISVPEQK